MYEYVDWYAYQDSLYHHGILGQKWGIRRYQNPDGSLTEEGRKRYGISNSRNIRYFSNVQDPKKGSEVGYKALMIANPDFALCTVIAVKHNISSGKKYGMTKEEITKLKTLANDLGNGLNLSYNKKFPVLASEIFDKYPEYEKKYYPVLYKSLTMSNKNKSNRWAIYENLLKEEINNKSKAKKIIAYIALLSNRQQGLRSVGLIM